MLSNKRFKEFTWEVVWPTGAENPRRRVHVPIQYLPLAHTNPINPKPTNPINPKPTNPINPKPTNPINPNPLQPTLRQLVRPCAASGLGLGDSRPGVQKSRNPLNPKPLIKLLIKP